LQIASTVDFATAHPATKIFKEARVMLTAGKNRIENHCSTTCDLQRLACDLPK